MAYQGQIATVPMGLSGLYTDGPHTRIPSISLNRAYNCTFWADVLQKDYGSRRWNSTALPHPILKIAELWPDPQSQVQLIFALLSDGSLYQLPNYYTNNLITPVTGAPANLFPTGYCQLLAGGNEQPTNAKKMFVFTGHDPVQVVYGSALTRKTIALPAADWTGTNQPFGGVIYRGRLWAFGNVNLPHAVYASSATNHEDFTTFPLNFNIYPGESQGIVLLKAWRGRLWMFKYPLGVYYLVDTDSNSANWYFAKALDEFGAASPYSAEITAGDLVIRNSYGSLTSMQAILGYGDVRAADLFAQLNVYRFSQNEIRPDIVSSASMIYYKAKQLLMTSFQSNINSYADRICVLDFSNSSQPPKVCWNTKDQPNHLFLIKDNLKVERPFYAANDGYLYQMDQVDRWVGPSGDPGTTGQTAYTMDVMTPHLDFGDPASEHANFGQSTTVMSEIVKNYDFLEVCYEPTGDWNVSIDVFIDGKFSKTYQCNLSGRVNAGETILNGTQQIDGLWPYSRRFQLYGNGRRIAFRLYNGGLGQDVRITQLRVYYQVSGQQQTVR